MNHVPIPPTLPLLALPDRISKPDAAVLHSHVGGQEVSQTAGRWRWSVEGESHGLAVRVAAVPDTAVGGRVVAGAHCVLLHLEGLRGLERGSGLDGQ